MIQLLLLADNKKLTAVMKAKESSPAVGWITSEPKMIAGALRQKVFHYNNRSTNFCPQT
jgi:hypothetical protein